MKKEQTSSYLLYIGGASTAALSADHFLTLSAQRFSILLAFVIHSLSFRPAFS